MAVGLFAVLVFVVVLFLYLHIAHQRRAVEDTEINILDVQTSAILDEVCELRVPYVFERDVSSLCNAGLQRKLLLNADSSEFVKAYDLSGTELVSSMKPWSTFCDSIKKQTGICISDRIQWPLDQWKVEPSISNYERFWKPYMNVNGNRFLTIGSEGSRTLYRSSSHGRQFLTCLDGVVKIMLLSPGNGNRGDSSEDEEGGRVYQRHVSHTTDQSLVVTVRRGQVVCVPPYWWYSIQIGGGGLLLETKYRSLANVVAHVDTLATVLLKQLNTRKRIGGPSALDDSNRLSDAIPTESVLGGVDDVK